MDSHSICSVSFWTNDMILFFESFHTLTHPYAAPSVLHIAVLLSIGPPHKLASVQLQTQIMEWVFAQEIKSFQVHICLIHTILRPEWPQFDLAVHAEAKRACRRAARSQRTEAFCRGPTCSGGSRRKGSLLMLAPNAALVQQPWPSPDQLSNKRCGHPGRRQTKGKND